MMTPSGKTRLGEPPSLRRSLRLLPLLFHLIAVRTAKPASAKPRAMRNIKGAP